jgi:hypothetical protein
MLRATLILLLALLPAKLPSEAMRPKPLPIYLHPQGPMEWLGLKAGHVYQLQWSKRPGKWHKTKTLARWTDPASLWTPPDRASLATHTSPPAPPGLTKPQAEEYAYRLEDVTGK